MRKPRFANLWQTMLQRLGRTQPRKAVVSTQSTGEFDQTLKNTINMSSHNETQLQKKEALGEKINARVDSINTENERRRAAKEEKKSEDESVPLYLSWFNEQKNAVIEGIKSASEGKIGKESLPAHIDSLYAIMSSLKKKFTESTIFLPSYEIRSSQVTIENLENQLETAKSTLLPRKKFAFSKKSASTPTTTTETNTTPTPTTSSSKTLDLSNSEYTESVSNVKGQTLVLRPKVESRTTDFVLSHLVDCVIFILYPLTALRVDNLTNCTIVSSPVEGSSFFDKCENCEFYLTSQQVRIHNSHHSNFYLLVKSHPIIEDCNTLGFAPFDGVCEGLVEWSPLQEKWNEKNLGESSKEGYNKWDKVEDFNWLRNDTKSPNWFVTEKKTISYPVVK
eukprot:TRINITY_DN4011_c0_g1_i2.p1 TRINITY_DN4011_c0_g1~~TRINITY_DN4011_c0_g1_i2.p1  ORF type:complete len:393 (+),score=74.96 TRINITY_DN4011_c0_g1_i2:16-1194(+)